MQLKFLYNPRIKRILRSLLGQTLYLKIVSFPHSSAIVSLRKWIFNLGLNYSYRSVPAAVAIETNAYCNRRCSYCPNSKYDRGTNRDAKMSEKIFHKIIDELAELNYYRTIYFNIYNEPLTDERLPEFIGYTRYKLPKATIEISTNGDYLDYSLYCLLLEKGVNRFVISIHGENPSVKLVKTFKNISEKEKAKNIIVRNVYRDYKNGHDVFFNRGGTIRINKRLADSKPCEYVLACNIDYTGKVILCCNDYLGEHVFGNVNNQSLRDIWSDKNYMGLRTRIAFGYRDLPICRICNI